MLTEKLALHLSLPSLRRLTSLRTLDVTVPIKMSPAALHVNRFVWTRFMDMLLDLPAALGAHPYASVFPGTLAPASLPPKAPSGKLQTVRIAFGNPRWTALAEMPYVLGVVRALDWGRLDAVMERHWPQDEDDHARCARPGVSADSSGDVKPGRLQLSIASRPSSRAQVERAVLGKLSPQVKYISRFS